MNRTIVNNQQGSAILEALIAILIFSIGILAIIGLQAASVSNTAAAKYRTDASLLANQVIGQMWVSDNANLAADFAGSQGSGGAKYLAWVGSVEATLPGPTNSPLNEPTISFAGNTATVTVFWRQASESSRHQYVATAMINNTLQ